MAEENPAAAVDNSAEIDRLKKEIELLKQKNREVVEEKQKITSNAKSVATLPEGTDVQALIEFKQKVEQERLEEKGQYSEALNKREEQFKEAIQKKDDEINSLKNELKELKLVTPAVSALSELVHDPDYAMSKLDKDKIQVQKDGAVVYLSDDGFTSKANTRSCKRKSSNMGIKKSTACWIRCAYWKK